MDSKFCASIADSQYPIFDIIQTIVCYGKMPKSGKMSETAKLENLGNVLQFSQYLKVQTTKKWGNPKILAIIWQKMVQEPHGNLCQIKIAETSRNRPLFGASETSRKSRGHPLFGPPQTSGPATREQRQASHYPAAPETWKPY